IDHAKDRRIGPDSEPERDNSDHRDAGVSQKHSERVSQIVEQDRHIDSYRCEDFRNVSDVNRVLVSARCEIFGMPITTLCINPSNTQAISQSISFTLRAIFGSTFVARLAEM